MIPLHSILTIVAEKGLGIPGIVLAVSVGILVLAFVIGFVKGFRKVSWNGLAWFIAGAALCLCGTMFGAAQNSPTGSFVTATLIAIACIGCVLILYGLLTYFARPKMRWIKDDVNPDLSLAEYGLEFEPEYLDYDGEHDYAPYGKRIYKTGYGTPSVFARLMGGLACVVNVGVVLWAALAAFMMIVNMMGLDNAILGEFLNDKNMLMILGLGQKFLLDFLMVAIIFFIAKKGYEKGLIDSIRSFVVSVGAFAAMWFSFSLAFTTPEGEGVIGQLVVNCMNVFAKYDVIGGVLGKLLAGVCLLALFSLFLVLLNVLLSKFCQMIQHTKITRGIDRCIACVCYMCVGVVACLAVCLVFALLDTLGVFASSSLFEGSYFAKAMFEFGKTLVEPLMAM